MTTTNIFKIIILVLGVIAIGVGGHAYFTSDFNEENKKPEFHALCANTRKPCPPISYEIYFLSAAIAAFVISILFGFRSLSSSSPSRHLVEAGFHAIAGILVFIGGIMMIVSAAKIWSFLKSILEDIISVRRNDLDLHDQKIVAGVICLINGVVYVITAISAYKNAKNPTQTNQGQVWTTAAVVPPTQNYGQQNYQPQNYPQQNYPPQNYPQNPPPYSASAFTNEKH